MGTNMAETSGMSARPSSSQRREEEAGATEGKEAAGGGRQDEEEAQGEEEASQEGGGGPRGRLKAGARRAGGKEGARGKTLAWEEAESRISTLRGRITICTIGAVQKGLMP